MSNISPTENSGSQEPRIVLFAPADALARITAALAGIAAIVVTGEAELAPETALEVRQAGVPLLKACREPERAEGFDGVHLTAPAETVRTARSALAANAMLGAGAARTRHDAMRLGEALPDYVLLGRVAGTDPDDRDICVDTELAQWWVELFEVPCVCVAATAQDVADLATAGADFIGLNRLVWQDEDPARALERIAGELQAMPRRAEGDGA